MSGRMWFSFRFLRNPLMQTLGSGKGSWRPAAAGRERQNSNFPGPIPHQKWPSEILPPGMNAHL